MGVAGVRGWLRGVAVAAAELCYPVRCWGCGERWPGAGEWLCGECEAALVGHGMIRCGRCGQFVGPGALVGGGCWECERQRWSFAAALGAVPYGEVARDMVHRFKYGRQDYLARLMGALMAEVARRERLEVLCDRVLWVPLHWRRRLVRGYDQAELLATEVGRRLALPSAGRALVRRRHTAPQAGLRPASRRQNVAGSFLVTRAKKVRGRTVLLVDDVFTTGATAEACSRALVDAGARRVFILTFGRAGKPLAAGVTAGEEALNV
jgi:competence protein ComFC